MTITPDFSNHLCLTPHDIAQHLLRNRLTRYNPVGEPIYLRPVFDKPALPISQLLLTQERPFSSPYELHVFTGEPESSYGYTNRSTTSATSAKFLVPANHPLIANAPTFAPYLPFPTPHFYTTTRTTLSVTQSQHLLQLLLAPYGVPDSLTTEWHLPFSIAIERLWPTNDEPSAALLIITHPGYYRSPTIRIHLPFCQAPLPQSYTALHQNFFLGLLLCALRPSSNHSPWHLSSLTLESRLREFILDFQPSSQYTHPLYSHTPQNAAFHDYVHSNLSLAINRPTTTATVTFPSDAIHLSPFHPRLLSTLVEDAPTSYTPETLQAWIQTQLKKLQTIYSNDQAQQFLC